MLSSLNQHFGNDALLPLSLTRRLCRLLRRVAFTHRRKFESQVDRVPLKTKHTALLFFFNGNSEHSFKCYCNQEESNIWWHKELNLLHLVEYCDDISGQIPISRQHPPKKSHSE